MSESPDEFGEQREEGRQDVRDGEVQDEKVHPRHLQLQKLCLFCS